ncbi:MAG TPA: hypothetical protein VGR73_00450 [Bryobacteraceae bacterium]|nr:hypothetical protein [Bryobacteraceae bacterium]
MKRLILAMGLFAASVSAPLHAQSMDMRGNIPFDFRIGSTVLPSGEYSIHHSGDMLFVRQIAGGNKGGFFLTIGEDHPATATEKATLQFNRYGDAYYLSKVWTPDSVTARALPKTPRERELASHAGRSGTASVALRTK